MANNSPPHIPKPLKCIIKSLDSDVEVHAHFNPKEITVEKSIPWNKHKTSKGNQPTLEFTDAEPKELTIELLFDTFESKKNVYHESIKKLEKLTLIVDDKKKRPPMCIFLWGTHFPSFMGVVESVSTKYQMFLSNGTPVRATSTVKIKQAEKLTLGSDDPNNPDKKSNAPVDDYSKEGRLAREDEAKRADKFGPNHRDTLDRLGSDDGTIQPGQPVETE